MCVLSVSIVVNSRTKCYYVIMQWICANISGTTCNIMLAETETDLLGPARTCPIHSRRLMTIIIVGYANIKHDAKVTYWNHRFRIAVIIIILRSESEVAETTFRRHRRAVRPSSVEFRPTAASTRCSRAKGYNILWVPTSNNNNNNIMWARRVLDGDNNNNYYNYWSRGRPTSPTRTAVHDVKW